MRVDVDKVASKGTVVVLPLPSVAVIVSTRKFQRLGVAVFTTLPGGRDGTGTELSLAIVTEQSQPKGQLEVSFGGLSEQTSSPA